MNQKLDGIMEAPLEALRVTQATGHSLESSRHYGETFSKKLGELEYFHGAEPGIEDAALYGTILAFKVMMVSVVVWSPATNSVCSTPTI